MNSRPCPINRKSGPRFVTPMTAMVLGLAVMGCDPAGPAGRGTPNNWRIVASTDDFILDAPQEAWRLDPPAGWQVAGPPEQRYLRIEPKEGSATPAWPGATARFTRHSFRSFSLSVQVMMQAGIDGRREACVLWGLDPAGSTGTMLHLRESGERWRLSVSALNAGAAGPLPGGEAEVPVGRGGWHRVDVLRDADAGLVRVFIDATPGAASTPVLLIRGRDDAVGWVGLGSPGNAARFARFAVEGQVR